MVCHDGSEASQQALETVKHGLLRDKDSLVVAHAWSEEKEAYLKYNFKRSYVKETQEASFLYLGKRFHYKEESIEKGDTAKNVLNKIA